MCKGQITVRDSYFEGACDDWLNVHGIHFKIKKKNKNQLTVIFMHPQAHGFNPLNVGDKIAAIDTKSLLQKDEAVIVSSALRGEYEIDLTLDKELNCSAGDVIEDITLCPDVLFENNTATRIITRGLLLTTRGRVVIRNNHFISNSMSGILLSDDARTWYESGMCRDVTVENNVFDYCGQTPILIKPENLVHAGAVHRNITIRNNTFKKYDGECIYAKSSDNIVISGNIISGGELIKQKNCSNVSFENNK